MLDVIHLVVNMMLHVKRDREPCSLNSWKLHSKYISLIDMLSLLRQHMVVCCELVAHCVFKSKPKKTIKNPEKPINVDQPKHR